MVTVNPEERLLASGLIIPHVNDPDRQAADARDIGTVVAAGPGKRLAIGKGDQRRPVSVAPGDRVVFGRNKGQAIRYHEREYTVLREAHLIGKLNGHGFEPLNDYVVAEDVKREKVSDGGIVVPDLRDRDEATVIAVGPGMIGDDGVLEELTVKPGDVILYNPRMAEPFENEGKQLIALHEAHIVCITNRDAGA